jgi:hypothetical protein
MHKKARKTGGHRRLAGCFDPFRSFDYFLCLFAPFRGYRVAAFPDSVSQILTRINSIQESSHGPQHAAAVVFVAV